MLIDRLVRLLLPPQGQFFNLLEGISDQIEAAAGVFAELETADGHAQMETIAVRLKTIEKAADELERRLHEELDRTFVTPDRPGGPGRPVQGPGRRGGRDGARGHVRRPVPVRPADRPDAGPGAAAGPGGQQLAAAGRALRRFADAEAGHAAGKAIHELETEADGVYRKAVAALFTDHLSPADLVRQKDMLFALEGAIDQCEDAMDVIRSVVVKNG